ncbi:hypothetical protein SAZ11_56795 [Streptomyces sp. FXJ1.4098]|nr:hypothetical protein [Streptomyces sp. FXJ1.4098]
MLAALLVTTVISVVLGVLAATRGGAVDRIAQGVSMVGYLVPNLLTAIALVYVLAVKLHWFPATGYTRWRRTRQAGPPPSPSPSSL